ncbi:MAG: pyrroline-5-carboxylate reductase [Alphaproteobacteria bacterium]|nr:pyrroline-5-carboxylate reductase [Alphaproteobacteria bacterium]
MSLSPGFAPVLVIGAGHMGGALVAGWRAAGVLHASDFIVIDPNPGEAARAAVAAGARLNPPRAEMAAARTVILGLKPQIWREALDALGAPISPHATVVSIMAGVPAAEIAARFPGCPIVRAMPTTSVAVGKGAAGIWSADAAAGAQIVELFSVLGAVARLDDEAQIHAVTAASGSAPAYIYALVEALERAGREVGLGADAARVLARQALIGAAALMEASGESPETLRRQVTSPKGTTEAALKVLIGGGELDALLARAVAAAKARSVELGGGA